MNNAANLVTRDEEKADVLNKFLSQFLMSDFHASQMGAKEDTNWKNKELPTVSRDQIHSHLRNLNVHKFMGLHKMQPRILRE